MKSLITLLILSSTLSVKPAVGDVKHQRANTRTSHKVVNAPSIFSEKSVNRLADVIFLVEGGTSTKHPYGIMGVWKLPPRQVCVNTIRNHAKRIGNAAAIDKPFILSLANVYCPQSTDKQGNVNWKRNVCKLMKF